MQKKDEKARAFYRAYGFIDLADRPNRLFLPLRTIEQLFSDVATEDSG
jgi:hypothetical protein